MSFAVPDAVREFSTSFAMLDPVRGARRRSRCLMPFATLDAFAMSGAVRDAR
jgi:hypothetical protein